MKEKNVINTDVGILPDRIGMAASRKPTSMGRTGSKDLHQERRAVEEHRERTATKDSISSRGLSGGRKVVDVGDDGSGRCGICSAQFAIRGVLDCCSHVFCFDCIDNWSAVSNLCPLCKLQFRFISVENVHEQDDHMAEDPSAVTVKHEREQESWGDEDVLPFSFPSFFIDEDAVACLEGNRCLVRAGVPLHDEDAADTSVACDSCDRWYHAGCVGFDPSVSWGSWLCPRCSEKAAVWRVPPTASLPSVLPPTTIVSSSTSGRVPVAELAYNATLLSENDLSVSISIADEGESVIVFSNREVTDSIKSSPPKLETQNEQTIATTGACAQGHTAVKIEEVGFQPSHDQVATIYELGSSAIDKLAIDGLKPTESPCVPSSTVNLPESGKSDPTKSDLDLRNQKPYEAVTHLIAPVLIVKTEQLDLPGLSMQGLQAVKSKESKIDQGRGPEPQTVVAVSDDLPASYFELENEEQPRKEKRKQATRQDRDFVRAEDLPEPPRRVARSAVKKKDSLRGCSSAPPLEKPAVLDLSNKDSEAANLKEAPLPGPEQVEDKTPFTEGVPLEDLVHIVKDERTGGSRSNTAGGVRTRVVMRRDSDGRAAQIVEDIRQQMRSAAGYGASDDLGKVAVSDDKFFAAFKAALVRTNEQSRRSRSQGLKRRKQSWLARMLDEAPRGKTGGVRESLTRKLYAGGVSRKTWDRDWDVSFWKEQSARIKKAKLEATNVVEGRAGTKPAGELQRDGTVIKEEDVLLEFKHVDLEDDSILSRLYVADTSLFPRDNDIKPLSLLATVKEEGKLEHLESERDTSRRGGPLNSQKCIVESKPTLPPSRGVEISTRVDAANTVKTSSVPHSEEKKDKRQWALELLARKSGDATPSSSAKPQAGTKKDSYLLGQVPEELRPTLPPDRRSRVPTAVRQGQLNRILEHYLRKAKLTTVQCGYKLNSVISAAIAKESEIYGNSNSKGVYVNLCVRALAQQDEVGLQVTIPQNSHPDGEAAVTEALLATGLISDSPPGSPARGQDYISESAKGALSKQSVGGLTSLPEVSTPLGTLTGSKGVTQTDVRASLEDRNALQLSLPQAGEVEDVLETANPVSFDTAEDLGLGLDEHEPCDKGALRVAGVASSTHPLSPRSKMRVVLTSTNRISSSQKPKDFENNLDEITTGREDNNETGEASKANLDAGLSVVDPRSSSFVILKSTTSKEDKNMNVHENLDSEFSHGRKTKETCTRVKVGEGWPTLLDDNQAKLGTEDAEEAELDVKIGDAGPSRVPGEFEGDDWMKAGKFPDLESRIDKMRKEVLKMNSSFLSQFDEENVFGDSLLRTRSGQVQEGGRTTDERDSGGNESKASTRSVQKQVEAYVKEHLKPLYKTGVIKPDQFRYAISKTASKVMQHHGNATSADFLIVEGSKVKKLADQYLQNFIYKK